MNMRTLLTLLCLFFSVAGRADMHFGSYFIKGQLLNADNHLLANRRVLIVQGEFWCFFNTDAVGRFMVELPFGLFTSCTRKESYLDSDVYDAARQYGGDSIYFYTCDHSGAISGVWNRYYSDTNCQHGFFEQQHSQKCMSANIQVQLHQGSKMSEFEMYVNKLDSVRKLLNNLCSFSDSTIVAYAHYKREQNRYINESRMADGVTASYGEKYGVRADVARLDSFLSSLRQGYEIADPIGSLLSHDQFLGRQINVLSQDYLCPKYHVSDFAKGKTEYKIHTFDLWTPAAITIKTDEDGTVKDVYLNWEY